MKRTASYSGRKAIAAAFTAVCLLVAGPAGAAALGEIEVESVLNEPFFARIEVLPSSEDPQDWEIGIGDVEVYGQLGLERSDYADELRATLVEARGRPPEVYVEGRSSFRELILDLVVVIRSNGDQRVRHYPVLIDFPAVVAPLAPQPELEQRRARYQPPPAPPRAPMKPLLVIDFPPGEGRYVVASGDNLTAIAKRVIGQRRVNVDDVMDAIYGLNPEAFIRGDMNLIRAGASLTLPDLDALGPAIAASSGAPGRATDRVSSEGGEARATPGESTPQAGGDDDARLEIRGTPDTETLVDDLNQWLEVEDSETAARVAEVRRDLAFAAAEIETYRKENEMLRGQVDGLEDRVVEMERLLTLQSRLIDSLGEEGSAAADAPADPPDEQSPDSIVEPESQPADSGGESDSGVETADVVAADVAASDEGGGFRWILFPAVAAAVLLGFGLLVLLRSAREDRRRRQRTADLTRRLRETGERDMLPEDI